MQSYLYGIDEQVFQQRDAEGERWFTEGRKVVPAALPIEALPKQPWDSYKPDFWAGIPIYQQQPLYNLPYFWEGEWYHPAQVNYSYFTATNQQAVGAAYGQYQFGAPTEGIYTGQGDNIWATR